MNVFKIELNNLLSNVNFHHSLNSKPFNHQFPPKTVSLLSGFHGGTILLFPEYRSSEYTEAPIRNMENIAIAGTKKIEVRKSKQGLVSQI